LTSATLDTERNMLNAGSRICALAGLALCLLSTAPAPVAHAQAQATPPSRAVRPGWHPLSDNSRLAGELTPAQTAAANARLERILQILLQVPELARPRGFEVMPQFWGGMRQLGPKEVEVPGNVIEYMVRLWFFVPTRAIAANAGCTCIVIRVNPLPITTSSAPFRDAEGREIYTEPERGKPIPLSTMVYGQLSPTEKSTAIVVMTSGSEVPWKSVSREDYYKAFLFALEGENGSKLRAAAASLQKTPYEEWMAGAEQRRKDREDLLSGLAGMQTPAEIAKLRKIMEDTERELTANLRAQEPTDRALNAEALQKRSAGTARLHAELASFTPAQLRSPALLNPLGSDPPNATGMTITESNDPRMLRVLTPNYDFWRARRSPVEAHSLSVEISASGSGQGSAITTALLAAYAKLDWAALKGLLDPPN
jgi:hypothetical protein